MKQLRLLSGKQAFVAIRLKISDILNLDIMGERFITLAANYGFVTFLYTLEMIFVNTLIFRASGGSMYSVLIYRGIFYACSAVGMNVNSALAKWMSPIRSMRLAGVFYVLFYSILFIWLDKAAGFIYFVAVLSGLSVGLYWSGHNVLLAKYTTPHNRANGIGISGVISGIMNLALPLFSGIIIQLMPEMTGYRVMFGLAIVISLAHSYFMKKLAPVERKHGKRDYVFAFKMVVRKLSLRLMVCTEMIRGLREGAFAFFLNMLLFEIVTQESLVGFNSFLVGAVSILTSVVFGRVVTPANRVKLVFISVCGLFGFNLLLALHLSPLTIILFGVVNTVLAFFLNNIAVTCAFDIVGENESLRNVMTELLGFREVTLNFGRIIGLVILTLFPMNPSGYIIAMLALTGTQFITVWMLRVSVRLIERKKHHEAGGHGHI